MEKLRIASALLLAAGVLTAGAACADSGEKPDESHKVQDALSKGADSVGKTLKAGADKVGPYIDKGVNTAGRSIEKAADTVGSTLKETGQKVNEKLNGKSKEPAGGDAPNRN